MKKCKNRCVSVLPMSPGVSHRLKELQCFWQRWTGRTRTVGRPSPTTSQPNTPTPWNTDDNVCWLFWTASENTSANNCTWLHLISFQPTCTNSNTVSHLVLWLVSVRTSGQVNSPCSGSLCCGWRGSAAQWSQHCPAGGRAQPSGRATSTPSPWSLSWTSCNITPNHQSQSGPHSPCTKVLGMYFQQECVPEQSEVGGSLWESEVVVLQTVVLLQQDGHGAWMCQVKLLKLLPLHTEGLSTLHRPAWTHRIQYEHTGNDLMRGRPCLCWPLTFSRTSCGPRRRVTVPLRLSGTSSTEEISAHPEQLTRFCLREPALHHSWKPVQQTFFFF